MSIFKAASGGDVNALASALSGGADVNGVDKQGRSALHLAAAGGHVAAVTVLLEREADVDAENNDGDTAL